MTPFSTQYQTGNELSVHLTARTQYLFHYTIFEAGLHAAVMSENGLLLLD